MQAGLYSPGKTQHGLLNTNSAATPFNHYYYTPSVSNAAKKERDIGGLVQFGRCGVFILGSGDGTVVAAPTSILLFR